MSATRRNIYKSKKQNHISNSEKQYLWRKLKRKEQKKHENWIHMNSKQRKGTRWPIRCSNARFSWSRKRALKSQVARSESESGSLNPSRNCPNSHLHWGSEPPLWGRILGSYRRWRWELCYRPPASAAPSKILLKQRYGIVLGILVRGKLGERGKAWLRGR